MDLFRGLHRISNLRFMLITLRTLIDINYQFVKLYTFDFLLVPVGGDPFRRLNGFYFDIIFVRLLRS